MERSAALQNKDIEEPFWTRNLFFPTFYQVGISTAVNAVDYEKLLHTAKPSAVAEAVGCEGLLQKPCRALMIEAKAVDT